MQYSEFGKFIKEKRESRNISLNKFANAAEIDPAILCRIENLKQGIKLNILENISFAFNMTISEFLYEFEKKNNIAIKKDH